MEPPPDGDEEPTAGPDGLYILQLPLHSTAVASKVSITPGHDRAILQPALHRLAVPAVRGRSPGHDRSVLCQGSESSTGGLDMLHFLQLALHCTAVPPCVAAPQVRTEPSARMAANAPKEAWICCTFLGLSSQSPPESMSPQVRIEPSRRIGAKARASPELRRLQPSACWQTCPRRRPPKARTALKALWEAWISCTFFSFSSSRRVEQSRSRCLRTCHKPMLGRRSSIGRHLELSGLSVAQFRTK